MAITTIYALKTEKAVAKKKKYLKDKKDLDHLNYLLTNLICMGNTTLDSFAKDCEDRVAWYKQASVLAGDTDVENIAYWAMPRFADGVLLLDHERDFVDRTVQNFLDKTIGIHNWHIPPWVSYGRQKGADFNIIFSSVLDIGGIPVLLRDRNQNMWGQFCELFNYIISELNLERKTKGLNLIPSVEDVKQQRHAAGGSLYLCEQLACLPTPPTSVHQIIKGVKLFGYDLVSTGDNEVVRIRRPILNSLDLGMTRRNSGFTVSLPGLVEEVALAVEYRQSKIIMPPALIIPATRTVEPAKSVEKAITLSCAPTVALNWNSEEDFLLSLGLRVARHGQQLYKISNANEQFAALGLVWKEDYNNGTATLREGEKSITLPNYRPLFLLQSACVRHELDVMGLAVTPPATMVTPINEGEHQAARKFTVLAHLREGLWLETRNKLKQPPILSVLQREWPHLATEPDELVKAKRLHWALMQSRQLNWIEVNRIVFAVCDPMAQRMGTIGPKVLGLEQDCAPKKSSTVVPRVPPSKPRANTNVSPTISPTINTNVNTKAPVKVITPVPVAAPVAFDWSSEEMFLLSLAKKAVQQDQDLRAILDATDKFSALGLKPERKKHSGRFILSAGSQSITLLEYRPRFVVQAASIRSELASLGLDMELPTPETSALSAEEHNAAQLFTGVARLDTRLWIRTRDKLRDPKIIAALNSAWSQLRTEPDELTKAKGLHEALCQPGLLKKDDTNRVVLAVCDPLGRRLGSIAPQVAGIQHLIQPGKKADPKNYGD